MSSSLIILFTIYGAFLQHSGAGKFFIDFSIRADGRQGQQRRPHRGAVVVPARRAVGLGRRHHGDDRLGRLSDAGSAPAIEKNAAGGLLAAGGLGAIISPPVLGAAAFLIAEFLKISYLDVI